MLKQESRYHPRFPSHIATLYDTIRENEAPPVSDTFPPEQTLQFASSLPFIFALCRNWKQLNISDHVPSDATWALPVNALISHATMMHEGPLKIMY